jgi:hypothetical protein
MNVLAFDPYIDDTDPSPAKVAKSAKVAEIRHFPDAKLSGDVAKAAKPPDRTLANLAGDAGTLARGNPQKTSTLAGLATLAVSGSETTNYDGLIIVPCARCGIPSRPFLEVINRDGWLCDTCWPADPDDAAYESEERAAIMTEAAPAAPIPHAMPVSWADSSIEPTAGARCRCCNGNRWWTEAVQPNGWRCSTCHPGNHLSADRRRDVVT